MAERETTESNSKTDYDHFTDTADVFKLLEMGEDLTSNECKNIVLLLGNTGSGKSTFTQFIAGDNNNLQSIEVEEGTGEFIIIDGNDRIGKSVDSKTIIPEKVLDLESNVVYYDCPGFADTRNAAYDIAANFFNNKIIGHARNIKIILTVNHSSVRLGVDRCDFLKVVKHATEFIQNIDNYLSSIALIVTKVDNIYISEKLVPDEKVVQTIANYIISVKQTLQEKLNFAANITDISFYNKAISLIDAILTKNEEQYIKIAVFRRPNEKGLISKIKLLQDRKKSIKNCLENNISFTAKNKDDFGFTISDSSKNCVSKLMDNLSNDITADISKTAEEIKEFFYLEIKNCSDIYEMRAKIHVLNNNLLEILQELKKSETLSVFLVNFFTWINNFDIKSSRDIFLTMRKKQKYVIFLREVSNENFKLQSLQWCEPLKDVIAFLEQRAIWYNFLLDLYHKLSSYDIHSGFNKHKNKFITNSEQSNIITSQNEHQFLKIINEYNVHEQQKIKNIIKDDVKLQDLYNLLNIINTNNITHAFTDTNTLSIKCDFIKFSDVLNIMRDINQEIDSIEIFALRVFIDVDLILTGKKLQLFIISPKWEVIGSRQIVLDGQSQDDCAMDKAELDKDGKPGLPGGPAGSFIGIGSIIINDEHLSISADGGRGGPGQAGGDGCRGKDGNPSKIPTGSQAEGERIMRETGFRNISKDDNFVFDDVKVIRTINLVAGVGEYKENQKYLLYGEKGTVGGNGRKGGKGGFGGYPGTIALYGFKNSKIKTSTQPGINGASGSGGQGGEGGQNADNIFCSFGERALYWTVFKLASKNGKWNIDSYESNGQAESGLNCTEITDQGIQLPDREPVLQNITHTINQYKIYILRNITNKLIKHDLMEFYAFLNNDQNIKSTYNAFGLLNELQSLEREFYKNSNNTELITFYKSLLDRIKEYAETPQANEATMDYKKLLNYLYTATLSKIISMKHRTDEDLVIDIDSYFSVIIDNLKNIKKSVRTIVNNEYNQIYNKQVDCKIKEAMDFIEIQLFPEMQNLNLQIQRKIENILSEIRAMQNEAERETKILIQKQTELQKTLEKKSIFERLMFSSNILKCVFQIGATVTNIIKGASTVVQSLGLDKIINNNPVISCIKTVRDWIKKGFDFLDNFYKSKIEAINDFLSKLSAAIKTHPEQLQPILKIIKEIKSYLKIGDQNNNLDTEEITHLIDKLKNGLQNTIDSKCSAITSQSLKMFKKLANLANAYSDTYLKYKDDNVALQKISEVLPQQENQVLQQVEKKLHKTIIPIFKIMQNDISNFEKTLGSQSPVALDVSRWKIQSTFKDMKILFKKGFSQFSINEDLGYCVDKLDAAMNTLINIYEKIQNYNEQKELADYISDLTSNTSNSIQTNDRELNNALAKLDCIMKSNIAVGQFQKAIGGFKQFVFPFANYYLEEYQLPVHMELEMNIENLVASTSSQITQLKTKMTENKALLKRNFHEHVYTEYFCSGDKHNGPFYVWDNDKYGNTISALLSGKEIILKANILNNIENKYAIKFNIIQLNFRSYDQTLDEKINKALCYFEVTMKHFGNSYYRCGNKFYLLTSDSQTFCYRFKENKNEEPTKRNEVYHKIKNGQYMLSPYATWSFQLKNIPSGNFKDLNQFKGKVDLELIGHGQYVSSDFNISQSDLKQYYKIVDTISVTDEIQDKC